MLGDTFGVVVQYTSRNS